MLKQIIALLAVVMLAAGCQSQEAGEKQSQPASGEQENQTENEQTEQPEAPEEGTAPDEGTSSEEEPAPEEEPADENSGAAEEEPVQEEPAQDEEGTEEPAKDEEPSHYVSPFEMRDEISIGLTKEEVESVLQNTAPVEVETQDGQAVRYDYMAEKGYKPAAADPDIEAIQSGKVEAQVFIYYTPENTVERFRIYHKTAEGKAVEYRDEGNGEGTENIIN